MITYNFGENYEKICFGIFWHENKGDYVLHHSHNYWEFFICEEGSLEHSVNGKTEILEKGDAVLLAPGDSHAFKGISQEVKQLNIGIEDKTFLEKCNAFSPTLFQFFKQNHPFKVKFSLERLRKIQTLLKTTLVSNGDDETATIISFALFNIFEPIYSDYLNQKTIMPEWFKDLLIQCNSLEHLDWKPRDVCKYANYSQAHVNRMFRQWLNTTLIDYLIEIKMNNAIILLTTSVMPLSAIVETLGYSSISYFTHTFKKHYNTTPYQYKINYKKKKPSAN